jgi:hypothetical protein
MTFHHHRFRAYKQPDAHHYVIISKGLHFSVLLKNNNFNTNLPKITNRLFITHYYKNTTRKRGLIKSENIRNGNKFWRGKVNWPRERCGSSSGSHAAWNTVEDDRPEGCGVIQRPRSHRKCPSFYSKGENFPCILPLKNCCLYRKKSRHVLMSTAVG